MGMGRRQSAEDKRAYNRERYHRNREAILAQQKERYEENKEEISSKNKEYYQKNKEVMKERAAAYYVANSDAVKLREANRRRERKTHLVNLLGSKCSRCPQDHPATLDFHHQDPTNKIFSIGDMIMLTRQVTQEELEMEVMKCELLCKNCHAIEHCTWEINVKTT